MCVKKHNQPCLIPVSVSVIQGAAAMVGREAKTWGEERRPSSSVDLPNSPKQLQIQPRTSNTDGLAGRMARTKQIQGPRQEGSGPSRNGNAKQEVEETQNYRPRKSYEG